MWKLYSGVEKPGCTLYTITVFIERRSVHPSCLGTMSVNLLIWTVVHAFSGHGCRNRIKFLIV